MSKSDCRVYLSGRLGTHDVVAMLRALNRADCLTTTDLPSITAPYGDKKTANIDLASTLHDGTGSRLVIMAVDDFYRQDNVGDQAILPDTEQQFFDGKREASLLERAGVKGSYAVVVGPSCAHDVLRKLWTERGGVWLRDEPDAKPEVAQGQAWTSRERSRAVTDELLTQMNDLLKKYKITDNDREATVDAAMIAISAAIEHGTQDIAQPKMKKERGIGTP